MAVFNFRSHILVIILLSCVVLHNCLADNQCVCSVVDRLPVYELDYTGSLVIGHIRFNECKPGVFVRFLQMKNNWMAVLIEQKLGFVQTNSDTNVQSCLAATTAHDGYLCPNNRVKSTYSRQTGHCYEYVDDLKGSRNLAEVYCNHMGGDLLSITSIDEQEFIFQFLKDNRLVNQSFWTGLLAMDNTTRWSDGSTTAYIQPHLLSLGNNNEPRQCGSFQAVGRDGMWNYSDCSLPQAFICKYAEVHKTSTASQIQTPSITPTVPQITSAIPTSKHSTTVTTESTTAHTYTYIAITSLMTTNSSKTTSIATTSTNFTATENINLCPQTQSLMKHTSLLGYCYELVVHRSRMCALADLYCNIHGGHLVSVVSSMEQEYLYQIIASNGLMNTKFWTGLSVSSNSYKWSDDTTHTQTASASSATAGNKVSTTANPHPGEAWYNHMLNPHPQMGDGLIG
ncbi:uncharacterized protein LOC127831221 [Dreissena polymorpha]|uniref:uncharacterized protein LOC127831221 n=1 Tax=Dreissena polymorpha TaxID=45954 RepID=UPI002263C204|nr:uncharacterized protein LOC127831221 [Dreissena polymorpha]